jgi:hypothetical protein
MLTVTVSGSKFWAGFYLALAFASALGFIQFLAVVAIVYPSIAATIANDLLPLWLVAYSFLGLLSLGSWVLAEKNLVIHASLEAP